LVPFSQVSLPLSSPALESNRLNLKQNFTICLQVKPLSNITIQFKPTDWKFETKYCISKPQQTGFKPSKRRLARAKYDIGKPRRRLQITNPPKFKKYDGNIKDEN
jgi:hypothetical protein